MVQPDHVAMGHHVGARWGDGDGEGAGGGLTRHGSENGGCAVDEEEVEGAMEEEIEEEMNKDMVDAVFVL